MVLVSAVQVKSLALPDFTVVNVDPEVARLCSERLATELSQQGLTVITAKQIATTIGIERQKQLLGCGEDSASCLAEFAGALGTDGIVMGDLGRVGTKLQLNLRVTRAGTAETVATWLGVVDREEDLLEEVSRAAHGLALKLGAAPSPAATSRAHPFPVAPAIAAGVSLVAGGVLAGLASDRFAQLTMPVTPITSPAVADRLRDEGKGFMVGSYVAFGLGAAALGVSAFLWIRGEPLRLTPSVVVQSDGAVLGVQGVLP